MPANGPLILKTQLNLNNNSCIIWRQNANSFKNAGCECWEISILRGDKEGVQYMRKKCTFMVKCDHYEEGTFCSDVQTRANWNCFLSTNRNSEPGWGFGILFSGQNKTKPRPQFVSQPKCGHHNKLGFDHKISTKWGSFPSWIHACRDKRGNEEWSHENENKLGFFSSWRNSSLFMSHDHRGEILG